MPFRKNSGVFRRECWGARLFTSRSPATAEAQLPAREHARGGDGEVTALGDEARFDALVEKFRRPLLGFLFRLVHDPRLAEQLAEETFLRVYRSRSRYAADPKFAIVLYRVGVEMAAQQMRGTAAEHVENSSAQSSSEILTGERQAAICRSVGALPERERLAVLLHKYQGLDYAQIAAVLSLDESEAKALLLRAYATLREKLSEVL